MIQLFNNDDASTTTTTTRPTTTTTTTTAQLSSSSLLNDYISKRKPSFRFTGNMHGDEPVGKELILRMTHYLLSTTAGTTATTTATSNDQVHDRVNRLLSNVNIYMLPCYNPDGYEKSTRGNANGYDLNRNFPDQFIVNTDAIQPETQNMMNYILNGSGGSGGNVSSDHHHFVLAAVMHGGSLVASYGYDGNAQGSSASRIYSASPDDALNIHLATLYSKAHKKMSYKEHNSEFGGAPFYGVTNGAYWYPLYGGMQDYNYIHGQPCNEITLEVSMTKTPDKSELGTFWNDNFESMMQYMEQSYQCTLGGVVYYNSSSSSSSGGSSGSGTIEILNQQRINVHITGVNGHNVSTTDGVYYRMLVPEVTYNVTFFTDDFDLVYKVCNVKIEEARKRTSILRIDVPMRNLTSGALKLVAQLPCDEMFVSEPETSVSSATHDITHYSSLIVALLLLICFLNLA